MPLRRPTTSRPTSRPIPRRRLRPVLGCLSALLWLVACAGPAEVLPPSVSQAVAALPAADAILLGEQHDAPDHHRIERELVQQLADQGRLAALLLEMADHGRHTAELPPDAAESQVRAALGWDDRGWPWSAYGPVVMAAVRAHVPVRGANLPRRQLRQTMADSRLDAQLDAVAQARLRELIRQGHCDLLPAHQLQPMLRVQIARDASMARALRDAAVPGKSLLLIAGQVHVNRSLGIPRHLPAGFKALAIGLVASPAMPALRQQFDQLWPAQAAPVKDDCAALKPTFSQ